jgi:hypothetical protein
MLAFMLRLALNASSLNFPTIDIKNSDFYSVNALPNFSPLLRNHNTFHLTFTS